MRKLNNGPRIARPIYQHGHFCVRTFHLLITHPIYLCFLIFIIYIQIMDVMLYFKIRSRGLIDSDITKKNHTNSNLFNQKMSQTLNGIPIFGSLPIKKIMIGPIVSGFSFEER